MEPREIEFTLTVDDLVALGTYTAEHHPDGRRKAEARPWTVWYMVVSAVVLAALLLFRPSLGPGGERIDAAVRTFTGILLAVVIVGVLLYLLLPILRRLEVRRMLRRPEFATALVPQTLRITPLALTVVTATETQTAGWRALDRIVITADRAFLFTGPTQALIVPRRAFRDEGEFSSFVGAIQNYHQVALRINELMQGAAGPDPKRRQP